MSDGTGTIGPRRHMSRCAIMAPMKDFIARCKGLVSGSSKKQNTPNMKEVLERVDAQIGRAVVRLSDR